MATTLAEVDAVLRGVFTEHIRQFDFRAYTWVRNIQFMQGRQWNDVPKDYWHSWAEPLPEAVRVSEGL